MTPQELRFIKDNPNLSTSVIARFTGLSWYAVDKVRVKPKWTHSGLGIPFIYHSIGNNGLSYKIKFKNKTVTSCSSFSSTITNLDRLVFAIENDSEFKPKSTIESIFSGMQFLNKG